MKFRCMLMVAIASLSFMSVAGEKEIRAKLEKAAPRLSIQSIEQSEINGLYRVTANGQDLYVSDDGDHFVMGDLYRVTDSGVQNVAEERNIKLRAELLAEVKPEDKIIFPAKGETKARVAVFTDIDCGYCRKLHKEVPAMNELGIEVSYLAYPRAGIGSPSYDKIVSAWCSEDPLQAMTDAKAGRSIEAKTCQNPVADQYQMGGVMGVSGTPAILLEDGVLVPGYVPAERLAQILGI